MAHLKKRPLPFLKHFAPVDAIQLFYPNLFLWQAEKGLHVVGSDSNIPGMVPDAKITID